MSVVPKSKIVKEKTRYDDLLDRSPLTKKLLQKPKTPKKTLKKAIVREDKTASSIRVHFRDKKSACSFALLIQQALVSTNRRIRFSGVYNDKTENVRIASKGTKSDWLFVDNRRSSESKTKKRKTWNTDDFFNRHWIDMPPFENEKNPPFISFEVSFGSIKHKAAFSELIKQRITPNTKSIWFPYKEPKTRSNLVWMGQAGSNKTRYPVFIVSKGRAKYGPLTAKALRDLGVDFYLMVEPHEYEAYKVLCDWAKDVIVIPESNHGLGPGRARNACWDVAKDELKTKRHWVLDCNIRAFYRLHQNERIRVGDGTIFRAAEDFVDRYKNIPVAGFAYKFFHPASEQQFPFLINTRIYSCLLIDNDCPYRWAGTYNEDTILSLNVLKDVKRNKTHLELNKRNKDGTYKVSRRERMATVEFVSFLQDKLATQTMKGGNTAEFYSREGTAAKSAMLVEAHPDVAKPVIKYGRDHHDVDYEVFRNNWLIRTDKRRRELIKRNWKPTNDKNPYGMRLVEKD